MPSSLAVLQEGKSASIKLLHPRPTRYDRFEMSDDPDSLSEKQQQELAWDRLLEAESPSTAQDQARRYPTIALVKVLWRVECYLWDGKKHVGHTSRETVADECKNVFGWNVKKVSQWTCKYTKSVGDSDSLKWIDPPDQTAARYAWTDFEYDVLRKWSKCYIQTGRKLIVVVIARIFLLISYIVWWAMELRRPFAGDNKDKALNTDGPLLPRATANELSKRMAHAAVRLTDAVKDWIRLSAENGPEN